MSSRKTKATSLATLLGKTEVEWEIKDWGGPLGPLIRSKACCMVHVGEVKLRFHLRPFQGLEDPTQKWCAYYCKFLKSPGSGCSVGDCSCHRTSTYYSSNLVGVSPPSTNVRCSGYSLLVDVLSPHKQLTFVVEVSKRDKLTDRRSNFLVLKSTDPKRNVVIIPNLYTTANWTVDEKGDATNYSEHSEETTCVPGNRKADIKFWLSVSLCEVECEGMDGKWREEQQDGNGAKRRRMAGDMELISKDSMSIIVSPVTLAVRSAFFQRCSGTSTFPTSGFAVNVSGQALRALGEWMNTEEISPESVAYLEEMCEGAKELELIGFWNSLDLRLGSWCTLANMNHLQGLARKYGLPKADAAVAQFIASNQTDVA